MVADKEKFRNTENLTYHDRVFSSEINLAIKTTEEHYDNMMFREAVKCGFYDLQVNSKAVI